MNLPSDLRYMGNGRWAVLTGFTYFSKFGPVRVYAGFETDLASVPRLPGVYFVAANRTITAAVIHDWLYHEPVILGPEGRHLTRKQCDVVFKEAMRDEGLPWWQRTVIYSGVRVGGWLPWRDYRRGQNG